MAIRERYVLWRKENRIRLLDIAKLVGYSTSYVSLWENGGIGNVELKQKYDDLIENFQPAFFKKVGCEFFSV